MAITSIIPTDNKVPGAYLKVTLGVGRRSAGAAAIKVLLVGNKTTAGSAAVETVQPIFSIDDARTLFGAGSELFMMAQAAFAANPAVTLYGIAVTESAGTAASEDIVIGGGPATASGTVEIWIGGRRAVASIASGDTATDVGDAIETAINNETDWPVTASNAAGTVTVTAKQKGPKGNDITIRTLLTGGAALTHTALNTSLSSGATDDDPTNALDAVASERYHYIVSSHSDSTNVAKYETHVDDAIDPLIGIRQRFFYGSIDTLANTVTLSDAINAKLGELVWHAGADDTPAEIASGAAAQHALLLSSDRARPLDGETVSGLRPQYALADKPLNTELQSALNNGITPLDHDGSSVFVVRAITNYSTDSQGNPDYSVLDISKVEVPIYIADTLEINFLSVFQGFKLDDDPPAGTLPEPGVATPKSIKDWIFSILKDHAAGGASPYLLSNVEEFKNLIVVELDSASDGRSNAVVPIDVVEGYHQGAFDVQQNG